MNMKARCLNIKHPYYSYYGGRGITIVDNWLKFEPFLQDMGEAPIGLTLDRIDNNKGYSKENCRWASRSEQMTNRRKYKLVNIPKRIRNEKGQFV